MWVQPHVDPHLRLALESVADRGIRPMLVAEGFQGVNGFNVRAVNQVDDSESPFSEDAVHLVSLADPIAFL
jgi:hypothetical protein